MLKKLLKYDLANIYKFLIIFYILAIFFASLTRIFFQFENSVILNIIAQICSGTTISMMCSIIINNLMRLWVKFKENFYGDESYLTHTLPITKKTLYQSKIITAILTTITSFLVIAFTLFVAYYSKENIDSLKNLLTPIANLYDSKVSSFIIIILVILALEIINIIQLGFTGIILGHRKNQNKTVYSVIYGFLIYLITQTITLIIIFIISLFNKDMMNLFVTKSPVDLTLLKTIMYLASLIYGGTIILIYFINTKLFNKGVNVE